MLIIHIYDMFRVQSRLQWKMAIFIQATSTNQKSKKLFIYIFFLYVSRDLSSELLVLTFDRQVMSIIMRFCEKLFFNHQLMRWLSKILWNIILELANFFTGLLDAPMYDIIWTENGDLIDSFIPEILKFKEEGGHRLNLRYQSE